jgi:hypothetical protein
MTPEQATDFKLKFEGKINEVSAATLGYSLVNITSIVQEVSEELAFGQRVEIKVKATAPGSFLYTSQFNQLLMESFSLQAQQVPLNWEVSDLEYSRLLPNCLSCERR